MKTETQVFSGVPSIRIIAATKVLTIGLIAGTLDIADAIIFNRLRDIHPTIVLQYIASGLIGRNAFLEGTSAALLGLFLHYLIAIGWTVIYYGLSRKIRCMNGNPVISGLLYGAIVYLIMNHAVLPLSAVTHTATTRTPAALINGILAVVICIGLTTAVLISRSSKPQR